MEEPPCIKVNLISNRVYHFLWEKAVKIAMHCFITLYLYIKENIYDGELSDFELGMIGI